MSIPGNINQLLIGAASSTGGDAGPIKSVRFDKTDSSYLNKTFSDTGNQKTFTISFWIKKCLETTQNNKNQNKIHKKQQTITHKKIFSKIHKLKNQNTTYKKNIKSQLTK